MSHTMIYADNAATTALSPQALDAMMPYLTEHYGNPSSVYRHGQRAKQGLDTARETVAKAIGARADEIFFTSGGTESDNWAITSATKRIKAKGKNHIITTAIEHHAVHHTLHKLEKEGFTVTYLPVDHEGNISLEELKNAITEETLLITIMMANNEIGTILPIKEIGAIAKEAGVLFHTDAVQGVGHIPVDVNDLQVDMLSLSGHKFGGPKGTGALFVRKGTVLPSFIEGGSQENKKRAGTENVAGFVGLAKALEEAVANMEAHTAKLLTMAGRLQEGLLQLPYTRLTGSPTNRLPGVNSFVFECVEGEALVLMLDAKGICGSSGSACSSDSLEPSHVLLSIGLPHEVAHGSLRLSFNENNTEEEITRLLEIIPPVIERLRFMSPVWEDKLEALKKA